MPRTGRSIRQNPFCAWKGQLYALKSACNLFFFPDLTYASDTENLIQNVLQTNPRGCMYAKIALYILFTSLAEEWYDINYWFRDPISVLASDTCAF